jgi:hypothetical protein
MSAGWIAGYVVGGIVVLAVVVLVTTIILLARAIGDEAPRINSGLADAVTNTAPLAALRTTITYATTIVAGLRRGRITLGG